MKTKSFARPLNQRETAFENEDYGNCRSECPSLNESSDREIFENRIKEKPVVVANDEWLTTEEAAAYLKISAQTLRNLSSNGKVPYYKWQARNRYYKDDLRRLLFGNKRGGL